MKIAFRNSDTAMKKGNMTLFKKETPINMFDQISLIITPCLFKSKKN